MALTHKQQEQEDEYQIPYHWMIREGTDSARLYFGYLNRCIELLPSDRNLAILDAGCGDARFLGLLQDRGYTNLYGIDYSERAIAFARLILPKVQFEIADLSRMPYADNSMDVIFCIETVEHLKPETISGIIAEFKRVLKPGGMLVITVPSLKNGIPSPDSKHYQHFSAESLSAYIAPHLRVERVEGQDNTSFHPLKILYRLLDNRLWDVKPLRLYYNTHIWPRYFNRCSASTGRRLIAIIRKSSE